MFDTNKIFKLEIIWVLIHIFFMFSKIFLTTSMSWEKNSHWKRCKNMYVWTHIFSFALCLKWLDMALLPNVLHIVTCRENGTICMANRDKLRRPLLGGAPSSQGGLTKSIPGQIHQQQCYIADWLETSGLEIFSIIVEGEPRSSWFLTVRQTMVSY